MTTIKSYTDISQSKKLAEILPLESADMGYLWNGASFCGYPVSNQTIFKRVENIPCWSLASLLAVLPNGTDIVKDEADTENEHYMCTIGIKDDIISTFGKNPIDACVDMIEKLHELNLL